jgi:hypothetical protein
VPEPFYVTRPLPAWTDPETIPRRGAHVFRASWQDTLDLLADEIGKIDGKPPVVFQIDVQEADLRLDGMLRSNAKVGHPGVVISFESKYGPLRYATDTYERQWGHGLDGWKANIRAIALALQALRAVDRWGVTKRGEQYAGWKALPPGGTVTFPTADAALRWMREMASMGEASAPRDVYRALARKLHPDAGGNAEDWDRLAAAKLLLTQGGLL